jgi:hypothetical protein
MVTFKKDELSHGTDMQAGRHTVMLEGNGEAVGYAMQSSTKNNIHG